MAGEGHAGLAGGAKEEGKVEWQIIGGTSSETKTKIFPTLKQLLTIRELKQKKVVAAAVTDK